MWGESSKNCEINCQCSGLITESFKINSGNSATKRKQEEALSNNYKIKIHPHTLDFNRKQSPLSSPICTPSKRRVLGEIQNSPLFRPKDSPTIERLKNTPINKQKSPLIEHLSPLTSRSDKCKRIKVSKISRIFEERSKYRMANKENELNISETFITMDNEGSHSLTRSERLLQMDNKLSETLTRSETFLQIENEENTLLTRSKPFHQLDDEENHSLTRSDTYLKRDNESLTMFSNKSHVETHSLIKSERFHKMNRDSVTRSNMFIRMGNVDNESLNMSEKSLNMSETFVKLDVEEDTRDCSFGDTFPVSSAIGSGCCKAKLDFTDALQSKSFEDETKNKDIYVPEKEANVDTEFDTLHDLEEEFDCTNFDECSKYEIISTDSPNIISSGRSTSRKIHSRNFEFGAPLLENETSTSFNRPNVSATRMLNFEDENFEFTSPAVKKHSASVKKSLKFTEKHNISVKKSLKFTETPPKTVLRHERSDSSIGSMSMSPASTKLRIFPSDSTMSMESGFISELEDQFLDFEVSSSPKMPNFKELLSGQIKDSFTDNKLLLTSQIKDTFGENQLLSSEIEEKQLKVNLDEPFSTSRRIIVHGFEENQLFSGEIKNSFEENQLFSGEIKNSFEENQLFSGEIKKSFEENQLFSGEIRNSFEENQLFSGEIKNSFDEKQLLCGEIKDGFVQKQFNVRRPLLQKSMSFNAGVSRARVSLFSIKESENEEKKSNKRNERNDLENISSKRRRSNCQSPEMEKPARPVLLRAFSENQASIMSAMTRFETEPGLIGDFTLPFALPLTSGEHADLSSISCDTLAGLLRGQYADSIGEFQVIDCRYPYEYEGGHIAGAVNLYTPELVLSLVERPRSPRAHRGRSILVFHCEFSRERGPKLSRFLRSKDRLKNKENYPSLHYPELYLLHEGYRAFYQRYPELCSPAGYTAMLDPVHRVALKKHRSFSQPSASHRRHRLLL